MREWIPISTSPKGRLALVAVREFGARTFDEVTVGELATAADVTTGALYHHFQSKLGLYAFVRADVERRLLDRMEGAAAAAGDDPLGLALAVGFDFAVDQRFVRLLGEPPPGERTDVLAELLTRLAAPVPAPVGRLLAAAWRAALADVAEGGSQDAAREALLALRVGESGWISSRVPETALWRGARHTTRQRQCHADRRSDALVLAHEGGVRQLADLGLVDADEHVLTRHHRGRHRSQQLVQV